MMPPLFLHLSPQLALQVIFKLGSFFKLLPGTVRIHSQIASRYPCSRLWYFLRSLDTKGSGVIRFDINLVASIFLDCGKSTIYQWLREGKNLGFFRSYRKDRAGNMRVFLGGLHSLCLSLGIENWGNCGTVPASDILGFFSLRSHAAAITAHTLQHGSRFAARSKIKKGLNTRVLHPYEIFEWEEKHSCQKSGERAKAPFIVHVSKKLAFVKSSFVPFGISQESIGESIGRSSRSVRRYLDYIQIDRRQICQRDGSLKPAADYLEFLDSEATKPGSDQITFTENRAGYPHDLKISSNRLFRYWGHTWLRRCCIYNLSYRLNTMKAAKNKLEKLMKSKSRRAGITARCSARSTITDSYKFSNNLENVADKLESRGEFPSPPQNSKNRVK